MLAQNGPLNVVADLSLTFSAGALFDDSRVANTIAGVLAAPVANATGLNASIVTVRSQGPQAGSRLSIHPPPFLLLALCVGKILGAELTDRPAAIASRPVQSNAHRRLCQP